MMLTVASLIAGLATTPYAAFHFHRVTPYGVLANLAAMPVVSALVMPAGILGVLAIPFGLDAIFWKLMGVGIDWMIAVTQWVAALPGPLIATTIGSILMGLLRTPLRWSGTAALAVGITWACFTPQPDILIAANGSSVGVRSKTGQLRVMRTSTDSFLRAMLTAVWRRIRVSPRVCRMTRQDASCRTAEAVSSRWHERRKLCLMIALRPQWL
jgi:competence protein ComEC